MSVYPLVYQQPLRCFCAPLPARLDGLTDRVEVHKSVSPAPLTSFAVLGGRWVVQGRRRPDLLWGCPGNAAASFGRPRPFNSNSPNMLLFDIRHPSRDASAAICPLFAKGSWRLCAVALSGAEWIERTEISIQFLCVQFLNSTLRFQSSTDKSQNLHALSSG
jgi:hypothetical protein